ncbi:MAG: hypothetical protein U1F05_05315 [Burkholderiales bacterium]|jgi:hypothetical protein
MVGFLARSPFQLGLGIVLMKSRLLREIGREPNAVAATVRKVLPVAWLSDARSFVAKAQ